MSFIFYNFDLTLKVFFCFIIKQPQKLPIHRLLLQLNTSYLFSFLDTEIFKVSEMRQVAVSVVSHGLKVFSLLFSLKSVSRAKEVNSVLIVC